VTTTRSYHRLALAAIDAVLASLSFTLTYLVAYDIGRDPEFAIYARQIVPLLSVVIVLRLGALWLFGLYRGVNRYASMTELLAITKAVLAGSLVLAVIGFSLRYLPDSFPLPRNSRGEAYRLPWRIVVIDSAFALLLLGAARFWRRVVLMQQSRMAKSHRMIVVGEGSAARSAVHQMVNATSGDFIPVLLLVPNESAISEKSIYGVPIHQGDLDELDDLLLEYQADHVLLAPDKPDARLMRRAVRSCQHSGVRFQLLPSVDALMKSSASGLSGGMRDLNLDDLLRRDEVKLELTEEQNYVKGKTVLVTGAGGSIGGEIVQQMLVLKPSRLVMVGRGENSIFEQQQRLRRLMNEQSDGDSDIDLQFRIQDIAEADGMRRILDEFRPKVIFHAAAHKHVPLMEKQPEQAFQNNTLATWQLAQLAYEFEVEHFVMISTDKAVRPSSVMGASKRLAERGLWLVADKISAEGKPWSYCAVRFGNVLGSRGSVVPTLRRQIEAGGPLTITDDEMTRYFMTAPEAATLVIMAGALEQNARLYLLDMGEPVKIIDMARDLIRLCGLAPDDIEIKITGIRPGEKIIEELLTEGEGIEPSAFAKIHQTQHEPVDPDAVEGQLNELRELLAGNSDKAVLQDYVKQSIHDYQPANN
jgi:FlaA1/EpsC-like NDP-sugar epimerase